MPAKKYYVNDQHHRDYNNEWAKRFRRAHPKPKAHYIAEYEGSECREWDRLCDMARDINFAGSTISNWIRKGKVTREARAVGIVRVWKEIR